jgi:DNA-binding XRE family transcriptional regulator
MTDQHAETVACPVCYGTGRIEHPGADMNRLLAVMKHRFGWSRQEQAKYIGVSRRAISAWVRGTSQPTQDHLRTARALAMFCEDAPSEPRRSSYGSPTQYDGTKEAGG